VGSRKVRKNEAAGRQQRASMSDNPRRTLRDLPSYAEPQDERATNPVIRLTQRVTALPPPPTDDNVPDDSLEALAQLARRSSPPPRAPAVHRLVPPVAPVVALAPTLVPPVAVVGKTSSIPAMTVGRSSAPPPPSSRPPRRRSSDQPPRTRGLGTVVLSATVGAIVALGMWSVRSGIDRVGHQGDPKGPSGTVAGASVPGADKCPSPAVTTAPTTGTNTSSAASTAEAEPRPVSIDTLPIAQNTGAVVARASRAASARHSAESTSRAVADAPSSESRPVARRAASAPVSPRTAVADAMQRATFAARSCESGPQSGKVEVTFSPTGAVSSVGLIKGYDDAGVNGCVLRAFGRVRVSAFEGDPITVRKTVSW
jgi:hypothetical protein